MKTSARLIATMLLLIVAAACENTSTTSNSSTGLQQNSTPAGTTQGQSAKHNNSMADAPTAPGM
jgi:uncharacterized lipoprotein